MSLEEILKRVAKGDRVFNLGQIAPPVRRKLDAMAKRGELLRERVWWPFVETGLVKKTSYRTP